MVTLFQAEVPPAGLAAGFLQREEGEYGNFLNKQIQIPGRCPH